MLLPVLSWQDWATGRESKRLSGNPFAQSHMLECLFTIDYEIYGNGQGSLRDLVYEPTQKLKAIFDRAGAKMVVFVEAAELEKIEEFGTDPAIAEVKWQIQELHQQGHEIALHLHPQWYNGRYVSGEWSLDYSEYNLCRLSPERISEVLKRSISYLRSVVGDPHFTPLSFRAGNWLFQPTKHAAQALVEQGIKVDSSVFKGGVQHKHGLDYRPAAKNGWFWNFEGDVNASTPAGRLLEIPIYTQMVPFWKMATGKRLRLQQKASASRPSVLEKFTRLRDLARWQQPLKFDFCRMNTEELVGMTRSVIAQDEKEPSCLKPFVAIGHTKDLVDFETVDSFLFFLKKAAIPVSTFRDVVDKCRL